MSARPPRRTRSAARTPRFEVTRAGGGLYVNGGTVNASDVLIDGNSAPVDPATMKPQGSGVDLGAGGTLQSAACYFNSAAGIRIGTGTWNDDPTDPSGGYIME